MIEMLFYTIMILSAMVITVKIVFLIAYRNKECKHNFILKKCKISIYRNGRYEEKVFSDIPVCTKCGKVYWKI